MQDPQENALISAQSRWQESLLNNSVHRQSFHTELPTTTSKIDLAIISTHANQRPNVIRNIANFYDVKFWILEKVLAQNVDGIDTIRNILQANTAWVNYPRRITPWHISLRAKVQSWKTLQLKVAGGPWGLACNATHFFDFVEWISGEKLVEVVTDRLDSHWIPAKRLGNFEVFGTLEGRFSKGSVVFLDSSRDGPPSYQYELTDGKTRWLVNEEAGLAQCSSGEKIEGRLPYQSEMTGPLVDEILATGMCQLASLETSVSAHRLYIQAMLQHWRYHHNPQATLVPIT